MALTMANGPFGPTPGGVFNFTADRPAHALYWEDSPRRVRGVLSGETVLDSRRVKLLHETGILPVWYVPIDDVRADALTATDHHTTCPFKGVASYYTLTVGDRTIPNAAWHYPEPIDGAPPLAGYVACYWSAMDRWFEEDEEVFVHARDPYHRVDAIPTSRHIRVRMDDVLLADSNRATAVFETGLPARWYLPADDVRVDLLEPSPTTTQCPYKGTAGYHSVAGAGDGGRDLVWFYTDPLPAVAGIAGLLCFFNEHVDIEVDGEPEVRPRTPWSAGITPAPRP